MPDIPFGQLLILIAFVLFPLINRLLQRMQRRFETQTPRQPPPQPAPRTFAKPPLEVVSSARERVHPANMPESPPASSRRRKRSLFRNRGDLRRAVILMTVLGPCRANDQRD
jgi:hypothetical protein